jgi:hypothetical protein
MRDGLHRAVQQAAIMRHHQRRTRKPRQPAFKPHRGFQIQVVGRFIQQQQVGVGEQRRRQRHAHPPAAREFRDRPRLGCFIETKARQNRGGAGRRRVGADGHQPVMDFRHAMRIGGLGLRQQHQTFGVALQDGFQQRHRPLGGLLPNRGHAGARRQTYVAAVKGELTGNGSQQGGFAGAIAPDQTDPTAGVDRQVGFIQQGAPAHADDGAGDDQ